MFESPRAHHFSMYFVYVFKNTTTRKHYTGFTTDLVRRLHSDTYVVLLERARQSNGPGITIRASGDDDLVSELFLAW